jgi:hypothetical protein
MKSQLVLLTVDCTEKIPANIQRLKIVRKVIAVDPLLQCVRIRDEETNEASSMLEKVSESADVTEEVFDKSVADEEEDRGQNQSRLLQSYFLQKLHAEVEIVTPILKIKEYPNEEMVVTLKQSLQRARYRLSRLTDCQKYQRVLEKDFIGMKILF